MEANLTMSVYMLGWTSIFFVGVGRLGNFLGHEHFFLTLLILHDFLDR